MTNFINKLKIRLERNELINEYHKKSFWWSISCHSKMKEYESRIDELTQKLNQF